MRILIGTQNKIATDNLLGLYDRLLTHFGHRHWWPIDPDKPANPHHTGKPFEIMVGAILTQNTAWTNVEKSLHRLKTADALAPQPILDLPVEELIELIRPSGFHNHKSLRLKRIANWWLDTCGDNIANFNKFTTVSLREQLLSINGIGPETADAILLYALNRPVFVVDAYTRRIITRIGWMDDEPGYDQLQKFFTTRLSPDVELFNDFHAQIVQLAKVNCRSKPICMNCPVQEICRLGKTVLD